MRRLATCRRGVTAVEFALVAPPFLCLLFLLLDGGRMLFTQQALNELAAAAARCAAVKPADCDSGDKVKTWAVGRAGRLSGLSISTGMVTVSNPTQCNSVANMAQVTIAMPYVRSTTALLPGNTSANLTASACFPVVG